MNEKKKIFNIILLIFNELQKYLTNYEYCYSNCFRI